MPQANGSAVGYSPSPSSAILLRGEETTREDRNVRRLLDFFAIPWKHVTMQDVELDERHGNYAVVSSAECLAQALQGPDHTGTLPSWIKKASSVYVYGFQDNERSTKLLRLLTRNAQARVLPIHASETIATITGDSPEMCGPMSGMRVPVTVRASGCVCDGLGGDAFRSVIRANEGELFFEVICAGVRFYLNTWGRTVDISALSPKYFDVKEIFCETVPFTFFLKRTFPDAAWGRGETNACLIVDDPPLKRRYGFLDFGEALDLMQHHNFTTTIAFIPWNWRRTHPRTLSMFHTESERLSVVVHGCDHTAGEFAERSAEVLHRKLRKARQRIECFQQRALIRVDPIMVFPQGEFSPESLRALKLNGFLAAVNTEVAPTQREANATTVADLWKMAIMKYGTFPIFTRRYLGSGIENFAFDALLGKPCLIAAHHDVFRDHAQNLVDFVARLNSLKWNLVWRPLGEALRHTFTVRRVDNCTSVIEMFCGSLVVDNPGDEPRKALLLKEEADPGCVEAVWINEKPADFTADNGYLRVWLIIPPGDTAVVRIGYRNDLQPSSQRDSFGTNIGVAAKRYLSEFRDNYLSRSDFLYQSAYKLKHLIK